MSLPHDTEIAWRILTSNHTQLLLSMFVFE